MNALTDMNWSEFFSMGGYAFYVWGSYLIALLIMGGEVVLLLRRRKALLEREGNNQKSDGRGSI
jgi:heme exporter protein D